MTRLPTFHDIFAVMSAASVGDNAARVAVPDDPPLDDLATRFAIAVNLLLDDLAFRAAEAEAAHRITKLELERLVAKRTQELANVNQELQAFSYSVAHDLRAPLRHIDGFSQALIEDYAGRLDDRGKDHLDRIRQACQQMGELIDDLLKLSRVSRHELRVEQTDLGAIARRIVERLRKADPGRHVDFSAPPQLYVTGDPGLLKVALENLLGNAWKFTGKSKEAKIDFGATQRDGATVYFVKDNGAGFDMRYANKLFGAFQRLHSEEEFSGTGIGLATVQRIVHRHSGRTWAEGAVGRGAAFYFTLGSEGGPSGNE